MCDPGYDFSTAEPGKAGHFTQVIWKSTTDFGIGRAAAVHDGLLCTYIVARYRPAGNFLGEFQENVPKGQFSAEQCVNLAKKRESINKPIAMKRSGIPKIHLSRSIFQKEAELSGKYRQEVMEKSPALKYKKMYVVRQPYSTSHHSELRKRLFKASKKNEFPLRVITPVSLINVPSDQIVMNYAANIKYEWMNPKQNSKKLFMKEESNENNEPFASVRNPDDSEGPVSVDLLENGENNTNNNFLYNNASLYDHVMKETQPRTYSNNANLPNTAFSRYSLRNHNNRNLNRYDKNGTRYTNRSTVSGKHILCSYQNESIPICNPSIQPGASGTTIINLFSKVKLSPRLQTYKQNPMVEKKSTASNLSFGTNNVLPRDLSIDNSAIHSNQDLIKMAKIGIIALKLAKKAALEKKYSQNNNKKERDLLITALTSPETTNAFLNRLNSTNLLGTLPDFKNLKKFANVNNGPYMKSLRNYSNTAIWNQSQNVFTHSKLLNNNNKAHDLKNTLVGSKKDFGSAHPTPDSKVQARGNEQVVMVEPTSKQPVIKATVNSVSTGSPDSASLVSQEHLVEGIISKLTKPVQEAKEAQTELESDDKNTYSGKDL